MIDNVVTTLAPSFLLGSSSFLQVTTTTINSRMSLKFGQIRPWTVELAALECLEKSPYTYNGRNIVTTLVPPFSNGSSSFLQITRSTIKAWMGLNFGKIPSLTSELAALERLKKSTNNVVTTSAPLSLIEFSSFLQATRTFIRSQMGSKFVRIRLGTYELPSLERLIKSP